ncbi:hypothetical protein [Legionella jordanis]|nr:hypothetical protein [Legionella jordanis]VEH12929.1 Uncharacterised protein [Legionella jordanis]
MKKTQKKGSKKVPQKDLKNVSGGTGNELTGPHVLRPAGKK